jgi:hypothetical protein
VYEKGVALNEINDGWTLFSEGQNYGFTGSATQEIDIEVGV